MSLNEFKNELYRQVTWQMYQWESELYEVEDQDDIKRQIRYMSQEQRKILAMILTGDERVIEINSVCQWYYLRCVIKIVRESHKKKSRFFELHTTRFGEAAIEGIIQHLEDLVYLPSNHQGSFMDAALKYECARGRLRRRRRWRKVLKNIDN